MKRWGINRLISIFVICIIASLLCSCGGLQRSNEIGAVGLFSGNTITLSVKNSQYRGLYTDGITFFLDQQREEEDFCKQAEKFGEVQNVQNGYVLFADGEVNTCDAFYFPFRQGEQIFTNMSVDFVFDEKQIDEEQKTDVKSLIQIPLYMFADERLTTEVQPKLYAGIEYEAVSNDIDAFLQFYQHTGWYQVEKTSEGTVILSGYCTMPERALLEDATFDVPFPLELRFTEHYGVSYVSIVVNREENAYEVQ